MPRRKTRVAPEKDTPEGTGNSQEQPATNASENPEQPAESEPTDPPEPPPDPVPRRKKKFGQILTSGYYAEQEQRRSIGADAGPGISGYFPRKSLDSEPRKSIDEGHSTFSPGKSIDTEPRKSVDTGFSEPRNSFDYNSPGARKSFDYDSSGTRKPFDFDSSGARKSFQYGSSDARKSFDSSEAKKSIDSSEARRSFDGSAARKSIDSTQPDSEPRKSIDTEDLGLRTSSIEAEASDAESEPEISLMSRNYIELLLEQPVTTNFDDYIENYEQIVKYEEKHPDGVPEEHPEEHSEEHAEEHTKEPLDEPPEELILYDELEGYSSEKEEPIEIVLDENGKEFIFGYDEDEVEEDSEAGWISDSDDNELNENEEISEEEMKTKEKEEKSKGKKQEKGKETKLKGKEKKPKEEMKPKEKEKQWTWHMKPKEMKSKEEKKPKGKEVKSKGKEKKPEEKKKKSEEKELNSDEDEENSEKMEKPKKLKKVYFPRSAFDFVVRKWYEVGVFQHRLKLPQRIIKKAELDRARFYYKEYEELDTIKSICPNCGLVDAMYWIEQDTTLQHFYNSEGLGHCCSCFYDHTVPRPDPLEYLKEYIWIPMHQRVFKSKCPECGMDLDSAEVYDSEEEKEGEEAYMTKIIRKLEYKQKRKNK